MGPIKKKQPNQKPKRPRGTGASKEKKMPSLQPIPETPLSLSELVSHLEELVMFALECEEQPLEEEVSFVEIYKQLMGVRKAIDLINKDQEDLLSVLATMGNVIPIEKTGLPISKEDQQMFDKIKHLQDVCETAKERIYFTIQQNPEAEQVVKEKIKEATTPKKKKALRRKGKFRRVGGKKGWLPT